MTDQWSALIVDDNADNRELLRLALEYVAYTVTVAGSGREALTFLNERSFDLLVLDMRMPGMDGGAVLKLVRADPRHDDMIVIVATANAHMTLGEVAQKVDMIVHKPLDVMEFSRLAERLKRRYPATLPRT